MKKIFYIPLLLFAFTACKDNRGSAKEPRQYLEMECECCSKAYTNIDSAVMCAMESEKILLFAFVESDLAGNQAKAYDILEDPEIIKAAKKNYVLVVLRPTETETYAEQCPDELFQKVKELERDPSFIIANLGGYPFNSFDFSDNKEKILSALQTGDRN